MTGSTAVTYLRPFSSDNFRVHPTECHNMETLTLNCWVRGQDVGRIFEVEISRMKIVTDLKKAIKNEKSMAFHDVDAVTLSGRLKMREDDLESD